VVFKGDREVRGHVEVGSFLNGVPRDDVRQGQHDVCACNMRQIVRCTSGKFHPAPAFRTVLPCISQSAVLY
jgi:hypothetical protein